VGFLLEDMFGFSACDNYGDLVNHGEMFGAANYRTAACIVWSYGDALHHKAK
jgi:hypothetical protein